MRQPEVGRCPVVVPKRPPGPCTVWTDAEGTVQVRLDSDGCRPVLRITGRLDRAAVGPCRDALEALQPVLTPSGSSGSGSTPRSGERGEPPDVLVDLGAVDGPGQESVPLLGVMRRFLAARGTGMSLTRVPTSLEEALRTAGVWNLYEVRSARSRRHGSPPAVGGPLAGNPSLPPGREGPPGRNGPAAPGAPVGSGAVTGRPASSGAGRYVSALRGCG